MEFGNGSRVESPFPYPLQAFVHSNSEQIAKSQLALVPKALVPLDAFYTPFSSLIIHPLFFI